MPGASRCSAPCRSWRARCWAAATPSRSRRTAAGARRQARRGAGRALGRAARPGPLPAAGRGRHAPAGRRRGGQRRRAAPPSVGRGAVARRHLQPLLPELRAPNMRREGSPWRGLSVVFFRELFDHLTSARMLVLQLAGHPVRRRGGLFRRRADPQHHGGGPVPVPAAVCAAGADAAVVRHGAEHPGPADRDRARLRLGQRRIQPPHHVAHPGAADLSRRAAVREIPRRARHHLDLPDHAVADGASASACCGSASRRAPRSWPAA